MAAGKYFYPKDENFFVRYPEKVSEDPHNWLTALWFWRASVHNNTWTRCPVSKQICRKAIKDGHFFASIAAINSMETSEDATEEQINQRINRFENYKRLYKAFGIKGQPKE